MCVAFVFLEFFSRLTCRAEKLRRIVRAEDKEVGEGGGLEEEEEEEEEEEGEEEEEEGEEEEEEVDIRSFLRGHNGPKFLIEISATFLFLTFLIFSLHKRFSR